MKAVRIKPIYKNYMNKAILFNREYGASQGVPKLFYGLPTPWVVQECKALQRIFLV